MLPAVTPSGGRHVTALGHVLAMHVGELVDVRITLLRRRRGLSTVEQGSSSTTVHVGVRSVGQVCALGRLGIAEGAGGGCSDVVPAVDGACLGVRGAEGRVSEVAGGGAVRARLPCKVGEEGRRADGGAEGRGRLGEIGVTGGLHGRMRVGAEGRRVEGRGRTRGRGFIGPYATHFG